MDKNENDENDEPYYIEQVENKKFFSAFKYTNIIKDTRNPDTELYKSDSPWLARIRLYQLNAIYKNSLQKKKGGIMQNLRKQNMIDGTDSLISFIKGTYKKDDKYKLTRLEQCIIILLQVFQVFFLFFE